MKLTVLKFEPDGYLRTNSLETLMEQAVNATCKALQQDGQLVTAAETVRISDRHILVNLWSIDAPSALTVATPQILR